MAKFGTLQPPARCSDALLRSDRYTSDIAFLFALYHQISLHQPLESQFSLWRKKDLVQGAKCATTQSFGHSPGVVIPRNARSVAARGFGFGGDSWLKIFSVRTRLPHCSSLLLHRSLFPSKRALLKVCAMPLLQSLAQRCRLTVKSSLFFLPSFDCPR